MYGKATPFRVGHAAPPQRECALLKLRDSTNKSVKRVLDSRFSLGTPPREMERVNLNAVIAEALGRLRPGFASRKIGVQAPSEGEKFVHTFRREAASVIQEMLFNALNANTEGRPIWIAIQESSDGRSTEVIVRDCDKPIPHPIRTRIINREPLKWNRGRGLGLSLAHRVAHSLGARLEIESGKHGNSVTLRFPKTENDCLS